MPMDDSIGTGATSAKAKGNVDTRALAKETTSECTGEKSCALLVAHNCVTCTSQEHERTGIGKLFFVFSFVSYYILTCVDMPGVYHLQEKNLPISTKP